MKSFPLRAFALLFCFVLLFSFALCLAGCKNTPATDGTDGTGDTGDTDDTQRGDNTRILIDFGLSKEELNADEAIAAWLDSCDDVGRTIFDFYVFADGDPNGGTYTYLIYYEVPVGEVRIDAKIRENDRGFVFPEVYYTTDPSLPCEYSITRITFRDCPREPQTLTIFLDGEQVDPLITWK